jgi:acetyl esterase/lipase
MLIRRTVLAALAALPAACSPLSLANTVLPRAKGAKRVGQAVAYGTDARQTLDVYAPEGTPKPTVVVFVYGGSWSSGRRQDYAFVAPSFASAGYVTVVPDYRLVPTVRFPSFLEDVAAAVAWVQANAARYSADPARIVLVGHSAGAYNAVMVALDPRYLAAAKANPSAVRGVVGLAGPYDFLPFDVKASIDAFSQWPSPADTQPLTYVHADAPPALLLHGEADDTVFPRNAKALAAKLQAVGAPVTLTLYPKLTHAGILLALTPRYTDTAPVLADTLAFINRVG